MHPLVASGTSPVLCSHPYTKFQTTFIPLKANTALIKQLLHSSLLSAPGNHQSAFSVYGFIYFGHFLEKESFNMWPFVTRFFLLSLMFSRLIHIVAAFLSCLWLSNIPLDGYTTICLFIQPLMDIWTVSTFGLPGIMLLQMSVSKYLFEYPFSVP